MGDKKYLITNDGLRKLEEELEYLKTIKRKEVTEKIKVARGYGDLSENSEYDEAKNEQAFVEGRIAEIENKLKNIELIDESEISTDVVSIGSVVTLYDFEFEEEVTYTIVGSAETNTFENKISNESPVGSEIIGRKVDEEFIVNTPGGNCKYKIIKIQRK